MTQPRSTTVVIDSSALVALLADAGSAGQWVESRTKSMYLAAPQLVVFEAANVLRRHYLRKELDATQATLVHQDLLDLRVHLWPYVALAARAWALRGNVTIYDASYVALAELLDSPLITLDHRLAKASGVACRIMTPP